MLSLEEISDRFEIQQLLIDYSTAIDKRQFDDLDRVFTPDAYIDYRAMGGIDGRFPEVKAWLAQVLPNFPAYAHMLGNFDVRIDGDTASSRTICFNPMVLGGEQNQILFCGLWYDDEFIRTRRGLADEPPRRDEVLRQGGVRPRPARHRDRSRIPAAVDNDFADGTDPACAHRTSRRAALPTAFLIRSERYTETKTLKMSSRSRVSLELVMRHCPSIFS